MSHRCGIFGWPVVLAVEIIHLSIHLSIYPSCSSSFPGPFDRSSSLDTLAHAKIKFTVLSNQAQAHALFPRYDPSNPSFTYHEPAIAQVLVLGSFIYLLNLFGWAAQALLNAGLLGQILLGVIYGTPLAGWLDPVWEEAFVALGYVGLLIVVFEAGIHSSVSHLQALLPLSLCIALTGVMLPMALSFILHPLANFSYLHCFAAGSAMASTSLGTTLAVLNPQSLGFDLRQTRLGTALISAAVIDDVIAFVLAKLLGVIGNNPGAGGAVLGKEIARAIGVTLGIGVISLLGAKYALKPMYRALRSRRRLWEQAGWGGEPFLVFWMFLLWLGLVAGAGYAGTSPLFGAYLSGLTVAYISEEENGPNPMLKLPHRFPHTATIDNRTPNNLTRASTLPETTSVAFATATPLVAEETTAATTLRAAFEHYIAPSLFRLLLPIFFASIGYSIPFVPLWTGSVIWRGIIYTILMILGKVGCGLWLMVWTKSTKCWRGAVVLGLAMVARGEIGLLISQIAYTTSTPLLPGDEFLIVIWAIVLCTVAGPVAVGIVIRRWGKTILIGSWD